MAAPNTVLEPLLRPERQTEARTFPGAPDFMPGGRLPPRFRCCRRRRQLPDDPNHAGEQDLQRTQRRLGVSVGAAAGRAPAVVTAPHESRGGAKTRPCGTDGSAWCSTTSFCVVLEVLGREIDNAPDGLLSRCQRPSLRSMRNGDAGRGRLAGSDVRPGLNHPARQRGRERAEAVDQPVKAA